ncbi:MAG: NFACT family protein, partial [Oscillospiraceae bacterium]|nr:NFACT family protein [Oscillospiraceae bacterium]
MALDGIYLHLLKNEISDRVTGCRVDKIYQPSKDEILFTFRTRNGTEKLLLSAKADCARIQFTSAHIENPKKPPMLTMLLRKLLCGGVLKEIRQDGFERILTLVFDCRNDLGDPVIYNVIIEIMGRYSNIIITDETDKIIECIKRIDALKSSVRQILPGLKYALPPAQHKMNILTDDVSDIENAMAASHCQKRSKAAQEVLQGISPIVAREIEYGKTLTELKNDIQYPIPTVVMLDGPKDFTFFEPKQYDGMCQLKTFDDFSPLIDY